MRVWSAQSIDHKITKAHREKRNACHHNSPPSIPCSSSRLFLCSRSKQKNNARVYSPMSPLHHDNAVCRAHYYFPFLLETAQCSNTLGRNFPWFKPININIEKEKIIIWCEGKLNKTQSQPLTLMIFHSFIRKCISRVKTKIIPFWSTNATQLKLLPQSRLCENWKKCEAFAGMMRM